MVSGHNTNLRCGSVTFHVQTEDCGEVYAMIDTTVYYHGRVLHRRTNNYFDLLPLSEDREQVLHSRLDEQHRKVIEEIRSGILKLVVPPVVGTLPVAEPASCGAETSSEPHKLVLELTNAKSWLSGRRASLRICVREHSGAPIPGAQVRVEIEGGETADVHLGQTGLEGEAQIEFELPKIVSPEAALEITAEAQDAKGHLRFALRAKPRVPLL